MDLIERKYMATEDDILGYFKDNGYGLFDCGQGYYTEEEQVFAKVGGKYYNVTVKAEIGSSKQDRGDRLYFIDDITSVEYVEVSQSHVHETMNAGILEKIDEHHKAIAKLTDQIWIV